MASKKQMIGKNDKIVVTGGKGFLGGFVIEELMKRGYAQLVPLSVADYDLCDPAATRKMFQEQAPDVVLHLAALVGGIGECKRKPAEMFRDNMQMGLNVFEAARESGLKKLVAIGSVCAYPKFAPIPFKEDCLWEGYPEETNAPYGLAKKMLLVLCQAYRAQYGLNAIYLLPVNLYGPRDNFDLESSHVIPAMVMKFHNAKKQKDNEVVLWGDGTPTREFLYVEDCARGIADAMEKYGKPEPVNLGSGFEISIKELSNLIRDEIGWKGKVVWDTTKPNGQPKRRFDSARAQKEFGFRASTPFKEGIRKTVEWYLKQ